MFWFKEIKSDLESNFMPTGTSQAWRFWPSKQDDSSSESVQKEQQRMAVLWMASVCHSYESLNKNCHMCITTKMDFFINGEQGIQQSFCRSGFESTFSSHCPLSSNQHRWLTSAASIISPLKEFRECWASNTGLLGEKQVYLCATQPPRYTTVCKCYQLQLRSR